MAATPLHGRFARAAPTLSPVCSTRARSNPEKHIRVDSVSPRRANTGRGGSGAEIAIAAQRRIIEEFPFPWGEPESHGWQGKSVSEWARSIWIEISFQKTP